MFCQCLVSLSTFDLRITELLIVLLPSVWDKQNRVVHATVMADEVVGLEIWRSLMSLVGAKSFSHMWVDPCIFYFCRGASIFHIALQRIVRTCPYLSVQLQRGLAIFLDDVERQNVMSFEDMRVRVHRVGALVCGVDLFWVLFGVVGNPVTHNLCC